MAGSSSLTFCHKNKNVKVIRINHPHNLLLPCNAGIVEFLELAAKNLRIFAAVIFGVTQFTTHPPKICQIRPFLTTSVPGSACATICSYQTSSAPFGAFSLLRSLLECLDCRFAYMLSLVLFRYIH